MPFDHAASFELKGVPGNIVQDVINISSDASFVAVAIGYGFEEDRARPADLDPPAASSTNDFLPGDVKLSQIPLAALIEGFRLNPNFERLIFADLPQGPVSRRAVPRERTFSKDKRIHSSFVDNIVEQIKPAEEISFLFSILDSGTGRELQDEPIHNLASLGSSNGARPFRMLAQPLTFEPRSTIRLQIVERSQNVRGTLFIVLYGYKTFGAGTLPPTIARSGTANSPMGRVIPFDYVATFPLTGTPGNQIEDEIPINVEGGFVATSIGYGLAIDTTDVTLKGEKPDQEFINLTDLKLQNFSTAALQGGIRIRPNFIRIALSGGTLSNADLPLNLANRVFEGLNRPEDVSFRYSIFDSGTGRELQNQPINNIAGLGIANGDRPFKKLARPMMFQPRSTIRITVEERFGRGTLFMVFQGYKRLGGSASDRTFRPRGRS
ncbi:MAG TPA: hypothetical protein VGN86_12950 [Pyrinomonadaceae bacterium]|nr:hypothetical protein [Pyrinomonadaceae bacterium]